MTQLTSVLHYIGSQLDACQQIDIIHFDMSKAFDKVDHTKLLATSRELPVTSGVPQGSLLGPILFLLFVDDLPNTVKTSRVAYYVDDTKIFKSIDSITECNAVQSDFLTILSVGPNHLGSYLIILSVNTSVSPARTHLYRPPILSTKRLFGILRYRKRPWCGGVKQSYLGQIIDWTVCEGQQTPGLCAPSF